MKVDHHCRHGGPGPTSVISRSMWKFSELISIFHQLEAESLLPVFVRLGFGSENLSIYGEKPGVCSNIVQEKGRDFQASAIKRYIQGFPGGAVVKNLPANAGHTGSSPGLGRPHMPRSN